MNRGSGCSVAEVMLDRAVRAVRLENDILAMTVLVDKGADVYELIYKPKNIDVLWKSPWGLRRQGSGHPSAFQSPVTWIEAYEGGWQELFPNGGDPASYKGVELNFHGEASTAAWDYLLASERDWAELRLSLRLTRSPFRIQRTMRIERSLPTVWLSERITNEAGEPMDYMWGHHPAYGQPFLSAACRIDTNATTVVADDVYDPPANPLEPARSYRWPTGDRGGAAVNLSLVPGPEERRAMLGYFTRFTDAHAWCAVTNLELGFGVGLVWPVAAFPHAWFWQEMHASPGFPWYKIAYVMAIEPGTSYPGQGLLKVMEKTGTHRTLQPGESATAELRAVFYEATTGVMAIGSDGCVTVKR